MNSVDHRTESFRKKFGDAGRHLGVRPNELVSLKLRENVSSYGEYREFLHQLDHELAVKSSSIGGDFQGQAYLLSDGTSRVIIVEHETGLEILYVAGSIASLIGLLPLILQGWKYFRGRHMPRHGFDDGDIEIRRVDEKGNLHENHVHQATPFPTMTFSANRALASTAKLLEDDLRGLIEQVQSLTRRVVVLENLIEVKAKRGRLQTGGKASRKGRS